MKNLTALFKRERSFLLSLPAVLWQIFFMVAPVLIIVGYSLADTNSWLGVSFFQYTHLLKFSYFKIIGRSLFFALATAFSCLLLAYPVAYYLAFFAGRFRSFLLFLLTVPFWVNFLVQIYAWYFLLEYNGLINTLLLKIGLISEPLMLANSLTAIYLVMLYCYLPFMIMPLYTTLEKMDKKLLEASADLGATPWQTFWNITLPLSMPGIKTGLFLVLIPAFGEFVIPALLGGGKNMFVGSLISYYFLAARNNGAGSAFTVLSAFLLALFLFLVYSAVRVRFAYKSERSS